MQSTNQGTEDRLEQEYAEAWRPEPEERLAGDVVDITRLTSSYDEAAYPCVTIRKQDGSGEAAFHAFHTVAKRELSKLRPRVGDTIGIKYLGLKETQDGRKVHVYRAVSNEARLEFSWGEFTGEGEAEPVNPENVDEADDDIPF
jgi:hypothetical protein